MCKWHKREKYRRTAIPGKQGMLVIIHEVPSACLLPWKLGIVCHKFYRNFSFERSDISRLARLVRRMNEKQSLLTIVLCLIQHLTS